MATPPLSPPPIQSTVANAAGLHSATWARWFLELQAKTRELAAGGSGADDDSAYALASDLTSLATTVSGHTSSIATLTADDATLTGTVSGHTTTLSSHTTSIATLVADDATATAALSNHGTRISALEATTGALPTLGQVVALARGWAMP